MINQSTNSTDRVSALRDWDPNLQILANAGSGKTHTLVTRIIRLLVMGIPPQRIIALTFTRKAAGEFLGKLLQRVAAASLHPQSAKELSREIHLEKSCADYQQLLRLIVEQMNKFQLTTLDSFFYRVVTAFPHELGLSSPPSLLDTQTEEFAGRTSLRNALAKLNKNEVDLLIQALFERDEGFVPGSASNDLNAFRSTMHDLYLDHPEAEKWGNPERIWTGQPNTCLLSLDNLETLRNVVALESGSPPFTNKTLKAWEQLQNLTRGITLNAVTKNIIASLEEWKAGNGKFSYYRKEHEVSHESAIAAAALTENYLKQCTSYRLREAKAIHRLLELYEREYNETIRDRGKLTFSDLTRLLQPDQRFLGIHGGSREEAELLRLQLDERLDARFDHWLLDEFQDTSRNQFRALENILDEVITESARGGSRSFFCVGDIKQAIYGWREGDSRLFEELHARYQNSGSLVQKHLSISWRSSEAVLRALNDIFGNLDAVAPAIPEEVRRRWYQAWSTHERTSEKAAIEGCFQWRVVSGENEPERRQDMQEQVISLLEEMQPRLKEGMTIALLVRSGKEANEWLELLRAAGIEALSESNPPVGRDNPVAAAVRSALSLAVHPGDEFAFHHLLMEPLKGIFFPENNQEKELRDLVKKSALLLEEGGFSALVKWLISLLTPLIQDPFSRDRAASMIRAALKADNSGIACVDDFLIFLDEYQELGRATPHVVQVMTIHKSKGLEYDMVVLPIPGGQESMDSLGTMKIDCWHNEHGDPFIMKLPADDIRSAPGNETLAHAAEVNKSEKAFEELCVWYVAMSRSKHGLYVFTHAPKDLEPDKCPTFPQLLSSSLNHLCNEESGNQKLVFGNPLWHQTFHPKHSPAQPIPLPSVVSVPFREAALRKNRPSDSYHPKLLGSQAFQESQATALGSEIHALFESIEWLEEIPKTFPLDTAAHAGDLMRNCLGHATVQALFHRPEGKFTLWREQRFDILLNGFWISGCFDRVVIYRDEQGNPKSADLIDFKTDHCDRDQLISSHRPQLESYRDALSSMLGLPPERIRMILIHVRSQDPVVDF
jgi:ATP-dependent exoDNAse (exonuclease V) beta subunit